MFPSLETKLKRFEELEQQLQDPAVLSNTSRLLQVQREYGGLKKVAETVRAHHALEADLASARELLEEEADPDAKSYAAEELQSLQAQVEQSETELEDLALAGDAITRGGLIM